MFRWLIGETFGVNPEARFFGAHKGTGSRTRFHVFQRGSGSVYLDEDEARALYAALGEALVSRDPAVVT
jgi:hypothetical protein